MKRACKLQEFTAHGSAVTCLQLGRKTAGVLVTGGEDKRVNVWALGKPVPQLTLVGHQSGIESVAFDPEEVRVAAGAAGGSLRLWDLAVNKVSRTLTGHKASCTAVDFHPFGNFLASGSADTNVKVWDLRQRRCINTLQGQPRSVSHLRHSPNGDFLAAGSPDGAVKVWSMTAGKLQYDIHEHCLPITSLEFHPSKELLASTSADRQACFWNVQDGQLIAKAGPDTSGIRAACFPADGQVLLTAIAEGLRSHAWDPVQLHDAMEIPWPKVSQVGYQEATHTLVGCSTSGSFVGIWTVPLNRVQPWAREREYGAGKVTKGTARPRTLQLHGNARRAPRSQHSSQHEPGQAPPVPNAHMPLNTAARARSRQTPGRSPGKLASTAAPPAGGQQVNSPLRAALNQVPSKFLRGNTAQQLRTPEALKLRDAGQRCMSPMQRAHGVAWEHGGRMPDVHQGRRTAQAEPAGASETSTLHHQPPEASCPSSVPEASSSSSSNSKSTDSSPAKGTADHAASRCPHDHHPSSLQAELRRSTERALRAIADGLGPGGGASGTGGSADQQHVPNAAAPQACSQGQSRIINQTADRSPYRPQGLSFDAFVPASASHCKARSRSQDRGSEQELICGLMAGHASVLTALGTRLSNLQTVNQFWARRDVRGALSALKAAADPSATVDILQAGSSDPQGLHTPSSGAEAQCRSALLTSIQLENCGEAAGLLEPLLASPHRHYQEAGLDALSLLLSRFSEIIRDTCAKAADSMGVDLSFELRQQRCFNLQASLQELGPQLRAHAMHDQPCKLKAHHVVLQLERL
ncbi:hypothetical protein WJX74_001799 [Apatococcus lobatus]|uniref:Katanin p80 WD40 repeat-containing subunit B1 homolog n=1 Tax=Apatococcus lobatus TaxID=904363 RepID=A0AAW1QTB6_9CHLO